MDERELNEFQKAFRDRESARTEAAVEEYDDDFDNVDTQHGRYMTFCCDKDYYGIELTYVNEIIGLQQLTELPDTPDYIKGLINLRGRIIPIVDVRIRFGKEPIEYNDRTCVIVINYEDDTVGLIVDAIADVVSIDADNILDPPKGKNGTNSRFIFGIGKFGDEVKLLVDPAKLIYDSVGT